ncbi:ABC transporter permease, partial [Dickeya fangzhongdai]
QGRLLSSDSYRPLEILTVVALFYFVLIWPGSYLAARLERRWRSPLSTR